MSGDGAVSRAQRNEDNVALFGEEPGLCIECGTQCVADGSLSVLCPNKNCRQNIDDRAYRSHLKRIAPIYDDY